MNKKKHFLAPPACLQFNKNKRVVASLWLIHAARIKTRAATGGVATTFTRLPRRYPESVEVALL